MVEIFPFQQRSKGIAVEQLAVRCAVFVNTYVNPIALSSIGWKYYIVYCVSSSDLLMAWPLLTWRQVWILVEIATVYFIFPETSGRSLEELSFMFESKEIQEKVSHNVNKALETAETVEAVEMSAQRKETA